MKNLSYSLMIISTAFVYILFGLLKLLDISPVEDFVVATFSFMAIPPLFQLFGLFEVILGVGILIKRFRKYFALLILLHLISTFATLIMIPSIIFSPDTLVSFEGEFVFKNVILLSVAYFIWQRENGASSKDTETK